LRTFVFVAVLQLRTAALRREHFVDPIAAPTGRSTKCCPEGKNVDRLTGAAMKGTKCWSALPLNAAVKAEGGLAVEVALPAN
jgi:hypothetical protein